MAAARGRPEVGRTTETEQDEETSAPQPAAWLLLSAASTGGLVPRGSLPTARPHAPARRKFSFRKWIKSRKQLTSQRPSSWCILLYSHPLALNFPAAALSCFSIRGRIRESRQVATFLPGLPGLFFLQLPPSLGLHQPRFQGVELHLVPCNSPHGPVAEPQGIHS